MKAVNKKRAVKGMTLVEIIISMVVFAITALMLVQVGNAINNLHKNSIRVNKRVTVEKPYAVSGTYKSTDDKVDSVTDNMKITVELKSGDAVSIAGACYKTKATGADKQTSANADLQYVNIDLSKIMKYKQQDGFYIVQDKVTHAQYKKKAGTDEYYQMDGVTPVTGITVSDVTNEVDSSNIWKATTP